MPPAVAQKPEPFSSGFSVLCYRFTCYRPLVRGEQLHFE